MRSSHWLRRVGIQLLLGFASGLPIALCSSALQARLSVAGISLLTIGFATLITQPYVYKFLWAPVFDRYLPPVLGRRRGWALVLQLGLIVLLAVVSQLNPLTHLNLLIGASFALACVSASQDIVLDGYRAEILESSEQGMGASLFTLGYRLGLILSGGMALVLADAWGWEKTYLLMSLVMGVGVLGSALAIESKTRLPSVKSTGFLTPFLEIFRRFPPRTLVILGLVIVLYKLGDVLVLSLSSTFLLQDLHFSLTEVGMANKTLGLIASISGALIGGLCLIRLPLFWALVIFGCLQAVSNTGFWMLSWLPPHFLTMATLIGVDQFCSGLGNVAFMALLMRLCNKQYSATQYAMLSAMASLGRTYVGPFAAFFVQHAGWESFYFWSIVLSFPGVLLLFFLRTTAIFAK